MCLFQFKGDALPAVLRVKRENDPSFLFLQYWDLNSGPSPSATPPALFLGRFFFLNRVSQNYLPRLALNLDPPDLCLLSSYDYRREPPAPGKNDPSWEN
jgi:hypothetical protein